MNHETLPVMKSWIAAIRGSPFLGVTMGGGGGGEGVRVNTQALSACDQSQYISLASICDES